MSSKTQKNPSIRFKGFTDAWEQRKLSEVADFIDGNYGEKYPKNEEFVDSGVPFFTSAVIGTSGIFEKSNVKFISNEKNSTLIKAQSKGGDLILTNRGASMGTIAQIPMEYGLVNIGPQLTRINGNENSNNLFLLSLFKAPQYKRKLLSMNAGSAMNFVGLESLGKFKFIIPKMKEQLQIGTFFKQLDDTIALHQRQLDNHKELKKAMLQKMFPQRGESVPEIRFAGCTGEWEQRRLGEFADISTGKLDANAMVEDGEYDFYTSGMKKYRIDTPAFEGPAITIAGNGATVGYMHLADGKFNAYQRTYVLQDFQANRYFLYSEISKKLPRKIAQEARTGNIPYIVMDMLTELTINLPVLEEEQAKIGIFFKQLDDAIALHQQKISNYQMVKSALLKRMFV